MTDKTAPGGWIFGAALHQVFTELLFTARHSLLIATANAKDFVVVRRGRAQRLVFWLQERCEAGVEISLLHASVPSGGFLQSLKATHLGLHEKFTMRRCPRVHLKAVIADGARALITSANLTGAGLGRKSERTRNFEWGTLTEDPAHIDLLTDHFGAIWNGAHCDGCGRRRECPVPLEEADF